MNTRLLIRPVSDIRILDTQFMDGALLGIIVEDLYQLDIQQGDIISLSFDDNTTNPQYNTNVEVIDVGSLAYSCCSTDPENTIVLNIPFGSSSDVSPGYIKNIIRDGISIRFQTIDLDLNEELQFPLTYNLVDIRQPQNRKSDFSKTITLPGTKNNNRILENIFEIGADSWFNPNIKKDIIVVNDGLEIFNGFVKLEKIFRDDWEAISYEIKISGRLLDLFSKFVNGFGDDLRVSDLDFSEYNHDRNRKNICTSWEGLIQKDNLSYNNYIIGPTYSVLDTGFASGGRTTFVLSTIPTDIVEGDIVRFIMDNPNDPTVNFNESQGHHTVTKVDSNLVTVNLSFKSGAVNTGQLVKYQSKGEGYVYPTVNFGKAPNELWNFATTEYIPFLYIKTLMDKAFQYINFSYDSNFFNEDYFKRLICSSAIPNRLNDVRRGFEVGLSASQSISDDTITLMDLGFVVRDDNSNWNSTFKSYTNGPITIEKQFDINLQFNIEGGIPNAAAVNLYIFRSLNPDGSPNINWVPNPSSPPFVGWNSFAGSLLDDSGNQMIVGIVNSLEVGTANPSNIYKEVAINGQNITAFVRTNIIRLRPNEEVRFAIGYLDIFGVGGITTIQTTSNVRDYNLYLSDIISDLKVRDVFTSLISMFNLYIEQDKFDPRRVTIEPYDDFYTPADPKDWTKKLDISKTVEIEPTSPNISKNFKWTYKDDGDFYNKIYKDINLKTYGEFEISNGTQFNTNTTEFKVNLSQSVLADVNTGGNLIIPTIVKDGEFNDIVKYNPRIMYFTGLRYVDSIFAVGGPAGIQSGSIAAVILATYSTSDFFDLPMFGYAGHFDNPKDATLDLNFGYAEEYYGTDFIITENTLYNRFYKNYIDEVSDKNSKLLRGYFNLNAYDINSLTFRRLYYIDNNLYRLQSIIDFNPMNGDTTLCEFLKVNNSLFGLKIKPIKPVKPIRPIRKSGDSIIFGKGNDTGSYTSGNIITGRNNIVKDNITQLVNVGDHNIVDNGSDKLLVIGDNNSIGMTTSNVIIIGKNNIVDDTLRDVFIFGDDISPTQSGVFNLYDNLIVSSSSVSIGDGSLQIDKFLATREDVDFYDNLGTAFNNNINKIDTQSDGKILVGGDFTTFNGNTRNRLVRLNEDDTEDTGFYTNLGTAFNNTINIINIQSDGKILAGGVFTTFNGNTRNRLVRLNSDGTEDTGFYTNLGTGFNGNINLIEIQIDGKILVGGGFTTFNGNTRNRLVRLNSDGTEDTGFYTNLGSGFNIDVNTIYIKTDGKILAGGSFTTFNGNTRNRMVGLNSDGTEDTGFYTNLGTGFDETISKISIQTDGKILVGGGFTTFNGNTRNYLVRLNEDGTEDTGFYTNLGTGFNTGISEVNSQLDGKILVGGVFTTFNGNTRNILVRLNEDGTEDINFYNSLGLGFNLGGSIATISIQSNNDILIGGSFVIFNNATRNRIIRLEQYYISDMTVDSINFNPISSLPSRYSEGTLYYRDGEGFRYNNGEDWEDVISSADLTVTETPIYLPLEPHTELSSGYTWNMATQSDGSYILVGDFSSYGNIVKINPDNSISLDFNNNIGTGFNFISLDVKVESTGDIIVCGEFSLFNGATTARRLSRLSPTGILDSSFQSNMGSGFNASVMCVELQSDGKILVGGIFNTFNGTTRNRMVRLNVDGTHDSSFYTNISTGFNNTVRRIRVQSDGKILVGGAFTTFKGVTRNRMVRLNSDGTEDTGFYTNLGTGFNNNIYSIEIQSDGKILVGGEFKTLNGVTVDGLARLNSDGTPDTTFNTEIGIGFDGSIRGISIQPDGKIVVGGIFTLFRNTDRVSLMRFNDDGTEDIDFYNLLGSNFANAYVVYTVLVDGDYISVGGDFEKFDNKPSNSFAKLYLGTENGITANRLSSKKTLNLTPLLIEPIYGEFGDMVNIQGEGPKYWNGAIWVSMNPGFVEFNVPSQTISASASSSGLIDINGIGNIRYEADSTFQVSGYLDINCTGTQSNIGIVFGTDAGISSRLNWSNMTLDSNGYSIENTINKTCLIDTTGTTHIKIEGILQTGDLFYEGAFFLELSNSTGSVSIDILDTSRIFTKRLN
jgi:uncharacterized delta-60 repeat protein